MKIIGPPKNPKRIENKQEQRVNENPVNRDLTDKD